MPYVLKFLAPEVMASAVIGKGGTVIAAMRHSAQAKIGLTEHSEFYPGTDCRILTAQANAEESLNEVSTQIIAKINECVQSSPSEQLGSPGELKLKTLVPKGAVGGIIGKGGTAIKQLREMSSAKISIGEPTGSGPGAEQTVAISGTQQAIEYVMAEINRQVQALNNEPWFQTWASTSGAVSSGGGGCSSRNGQGYSGPTTYNVTSGGSGGGGGGGGSGMGFNGQGVDLMVRVAQGLPPYVMEDSRGFALSCVVPNRLVGGLIGRGGMGTKDVQNSTGTKISIREIPGDPDNRSMNIAGPLSNTCAAYMLMMKRYLDAEAQAAAGPPSGVPEGRSGRV